MRQNTTLIFCLVHEEKPQCPKEDIELQPHIPLHNTCKSLVRANSKLDLLLILLGEVLNVQRRLLDWDQWSAFWHKKQWWLFGVQVHKLKLPATCEFTIGREIVYYNFLDYTQIGEFWQSCLNWWMMLSKVRQVKHHQSCSWLRGTRRYSTGQVCRRICR